MTIDSPRPDGRRRGRVLLFRNCPRQPMWRNPESRPEPGPQVHYRQMVDIANQRLASLEGKPFANDPKIVAGWREERDNSLGQAAQYIAGQVGRADIQALREAVAPESLRDVLVRAAAGYDTLMVAGEGQSELRGVVDARHRLMEELDAGCRAAANPKTKLAVEVLWKKARSLEAGLLPFETKEAWTKLEAAQYVARRAEFLEAVANLKEVLKK